MVLNHNPENKELLFKAAEAVGAKWCRDEDGFDFLKYTHEDGSYHYWDSLHNINDAMIIVIELSINLKFMTGSNRVVASWGDGSLYVDYPYTDDNKDRIVCLVITKVAAMMTDENLI